MEPRPPRPRPQNPFEAPGTPAQPGIGERLYPATSDPAYYAGETYAPGVAEPPLLPRRQRRQRGALRGIAATVVAIALVAAVGWALRDTVRGFLAPAAPTPTAVTQAVSPGTPASAPEAAALPNALATVTPTPPPRATATPARPPTSAAGDTEPAAAVEPDRDISSQTRPLLAFLPSESQVPAGMILADEAERSKAEVLEQLGDTQEAADELDAWGWSGNAYREFVIPPDTAPETGGATFLNVSVHRFADTPSAAEAMIVFSDQVIFVQGLQEIEAPAIGDSARLLQGSPDGVPLTVLYAQQGPIMYRIGGSSNENGGDPTADVLAVAAEIIAGQADGG